MREKERERVGDIWTEKQKTGRITGDKEKKRRKKHEEKREVNKQRAHEMGWGMI